MLSAPYQQSSYVYDASPRSRATSFLLSFGAALLIVLMLLKLGAISPPVPPEKSKPLIVDLTPASKVAPKPSTSHAKRASKGATPKAPAPKAPAAATAPTPPHPPVPWNVTPLSTAEFASSDIATKPTRSQSPQTGDNGADGADSGKDSATSYGPGEGPGGEQLYNAEWYVRPSHAELAFYLPPAGAPEGWAMIACKTIANFHVDSCHELGESPGSGLAKALRLAAWQFRVRPPRIGGRPMIGAWVRIRFDFTHDAVE